jgi:hypothetical protein
MSPKNGTLEKLLAEKPNFMELLSILSSKLISFLSTCAEVALLPSLVFLDALSLLLSTSTKLLTRTMDLADLLSSDA